MKERKLDIAIVGGGASGCIAACRAAEENMNMHIGIIEKEDILMKKVIASGNGRCNIANMNCDGIDDLLSYFESLGIYTVCEDEGRLYPRTRYSRTVTEAIERRIEKYGIRVFSGRAVSDISYSDEEDYGFRITAGKDMFLARMVLLSAGGKAGPQFGTSGDSYTILRRLGHTVTTLRPSLAAIECEGNFESLKGIRCEASVRLEKEERPVSEAEMGEIQITRDGLSGICIMNLSRNLVLDRDVPMKDAYRRYRIICDFVPGIDVDRLARMIEGDREAVYGLLRKPLAEYICNVEDTSSVLAGRLKGYPFTVTGCRGWKDAQVTAGGVRLDEIDMETMESRLVEGLYVAGEALDYDGPCGGYNLYNAWTTGIRAGKAMAECIG